MTKIKLRFGKHTKSVTVHALLINVGIGVLFLLLIWQFCYLMIGKTLDDEDLVAHGDAKFSRTEVTSAERGNITDREGNVLASDMESYRIALVLDEDYSDYVNDPEETSKLLGDIIDMDPEEIQNRIEEGMKNDRVQVELGREGRNISYNQKLEMEDLKKEGKLGGVTFRTETTRFYPNGNFASHLIGFAEKDEETDKTSGQLGIERAYDEVLSGTDGSTDFTKDLWGYIVPSTNTETTPPKDGADIQLTIDSNIQLYLEESLDTMEEHFEPEELFAVVADAKTGEILGTGQRPSFNPRTREGFGNSWLNMLYQYSFEPGSTFKVFGLAAAIDAGVYDPNDVYESGSFDVDGHTIYDWEREGWGNITYNEGMQYSSNVLMMILQDKVGEDEMQDYYQKFGFGESTDSEYIGEVPGTIAWDNELQRKTTAFGQSSTVTPIQMIQGMTAILNGGQMKKPYVIDSITDPSTGEVLQEGEEEVVRQVISEEAADETQEEINSLINGTLEHNPQYVLDDYEMAGKTGTAQVIDPDGGGYVDEPYQYLTSFIGYAPEDDPEIIVYYGVKFASKNESDTWDYGVMHGLNPLVERSLKYLEVGSGSGEDAEMLEVGDHTGESLSDSGMLEENFDTIVIGDGDEIVDHYPKDSTILPEDTMVIKTDGDITIPDMTGLSKREAIIVAELAGFQVTLDGEGYVTSQSIEEGEAIEEGTEVELSLTSNDPED
jgi:penicillin-binding protein 1